MKIGHTSSNHAIVLNTDNLDAAEQLLSGRVVEYHAMQESGTCLTFTDPDGHGYQLVTTKEP